MDSQKTNRGGFASNFGFLMAAIGSAVGLGNLWGFPYKMGSSGGFAFLLLYAVLFIFIGYPLMLSEFALGRKSGKGAIGAYRALHPRMAFNGWFAVLTPFFLLMFYCCLGGYCLKYFVCNLGDIFGASWGIGTAESGAYFGGFFTDVPQAMVFSILFLAVTILIVSRGIASGIERFSVIAMPVLFIMLLIIVVRSVTLPGAADGIAFMFKPDFSVFKGSGWIRILASAGGQLFFSLSLASGAHIAYGSYLSKKENLEGNALIVPIADTMMGILAGLATIPAVFAAGMDPSGGPGMLFVILQKVFQEMGGAGAWFGTLFYFLVVLAAISSSIAMMEGAVSSFVDMRLDKGKPANRPVTTAIVGGIALLGTIVCTADALGEGGVPHLFGFTTWLDTFDLFGEGILMPLGGLCMTVALGWFFPSYIDDEVRLSSGYKSRGFVHFCMKVPAILFMVLVLLGQIDNFFALGWFS